MLVICPYSNICDGCFHSKPHEFVNNKQFGGHCERKCSPTIGDKVELVDDIHGSGCVSVTKLRKEKIKRIMTE